MLVCSDYAYVDGNGPPDPADFKADLSKESSSLGVVALRAAWGTLPDPTLQRDWATWKNAGATMMGYLFARLRAGSPDPEAQVDTAAKVIGVLTEADLPLCIDVEDPGPSPQVELDWVRRAWRHARSIYGVSPLIYTSNRVWHEDLNDLAADELADSPLWVAKPWLGPRGGMWSPKQPPILSGSAFAGGRFEPTCPKPWGPGNWWLHQYQGDAYPVLGVGQCDLSRFNVMRLGATGDRVKWVQKRLGMIPLGTFDTKLEQRIKGFQQTKGLDADGIIGPKTFARICWCGGVEKPQPEVAP